MEEVLKRKKEEIDELKNVELYPYPKKWEMLYLSYHFFAGVSALAGGAATIARAINQARSNKRQLEENVRHNKHMESIAMGGKGFRMRPWAFGFRTTRQVAAGSGLKKRQKKNSKQKKIVNIEELLPERALTDIEIWRFATDTLKLPYFRGVFMKDKLPADGPHYREDGVMDFN